MPRTYDWAASGSGDVLLGEPRTGRLEMGHDEQVALAAATGDRSNSFWPNLDSGRGPAPWQDPDGFDAAHAFLDAHATGPWSWTETFVNCGKSAMVCLYVERAPDVEALVAAFGRLFRHRPHEAGDLAKVATLRGVVAPLGPLESVVLWTAANQGYAVREIPDFLEVAFDDPWSEAALRAQPGFAEVLEVGATYLVKSGGRAAWRMLAACDAVGGIGLEDGVWVLPVRSPAARSRFACDWAARGFRWNGAEERFEADEWPKAPGRAIPQDFVDYLAGRREDYAAPFLLTAARAGAD